MQPLAHILCYLGANLGLNVKPFGVDAKKFGHILISNVGTLNFDLAFAPLCSPMFAQLVLCVGKIIKKPVVDETDGDKIIAKQVSQCVFTCDHRFGDAASINTALKVMAGYMEGPEEFDPTDYKDSGEK